MNGLFGIRDPRQRFGGTQPLQPVAPVNPRQTIGPNPQTLRQLDTPQQGMGYQSPSQGLFAAYMQNIFRQKYAPPMMQGSPLRNYGGFFGFGAPQMPSRPQPVQTPWASLPPQTWDPGQTGYEPGAGM